MIVLSRFRLDTPPSDFPERARLALAAFAARPGFVRGRLGRAADEPGLWALTTEWESVGAFRRSLSAYDVKLYAAPLLAESVEESAAYEVLVAFDGTTETVGGTDRSADADHTRVGESAVPAAPRDPSARGGRGA